MTTKSHAHRWICEPFKRQNVEAKCACGATRNFQGEPENPFDMIKDAPRGFSLYSARSDADKIVDEVLMKFPHRSNYIGA